MGDSSLFGGFGENLPSPDILLEEGATIGPFTVLHLPGHTQGSAAFWDKEAKVLFTGDTLFEAAYGRTDLPGGNDEQMIASLRRLFAMDADINVYPGHGGATTIGRERE
jgi:glyoxylase-like metal-dependent hydrolase (beta-lactamase superfamily II)